ncbi:major capsid protein [Paracoccus sp. (in: a-proteobacteria)]|uniref:major capsid protein n=1 Tax=Paracoccus sp. TaxID=267 RepID=UPI003A89EFE8
MALVTDVFEQNSWGLVEFQEQVVERVDHRPQLLGQLDIFEPIYSRSQTIAIASKDRTLSLIPTSEIGAPLEQLIPGGAKVRKFDAVRLAKESTIHAIELAGVTALPFDDQTVEVADEVTGRTGWIIDEIEMTWEHMRFGAVQGKVVDADGVTVLHDWYQEWGIPQPTEINFQLGTEATDVRKKCRDIKRASQTNAKGVWTPSTRLVSICGDGFFDDLVNHPSIKETRLNTDRAALLENIEGYASFEVEGITFINYQGTDDASQIAIATDKAQFFPVGARGAFKVGYAPANEFKPYLNKRGRELYGMILADPSGRDAWDRVEVYSYPLFICTRPEMLQRARAR